MNRLNKPIITKETIKSMEDMSFFTHAQIFDDLLIVAQKQTNCFVLKTSDGLIVIDAIWPSEKAFEAIVDAIKDVALSNYTAVDNGLERIMYSKTRMDYMPLVEIQGYRLVDFNYFE